MASDHVSWQCPVCGHHSSIGEVDRNWGASVLCTSKGKEEGVVFLLSHRLTRCPNEKCKEHSLSVTASHGKLTSKAGDYPVRAQADKPISSITFLPAVPKPLSAHVGMGVRQDFEEAYRIRELSPKASATLSRRALQGMIREFWGVTKPQLWQELATIKGECDTAIYAAMMGVKSIGNIGAHPERDVNLIVDVEPGEALQLLDLILLLDAEWYMARAAREARLASLAAMASAKDEVRKGVSTTAAASPAPPPAA